MGSIRARTVVPSFSVTEFVGISFGLLGGLAVDESCGVEPDADGAVVGGVPSDPGVPRPSLSLFVLLNEVDLCSCFASSLLDASGGMWMRGWKVLGENSLYGSQQVAI